MDSHGIDGARIPGDVSRDAFLVSGLRLHSSAGQAAGLEGVDPPEIAFRVGFLGVGL